MPSIVAVRGAITVDFNTPDNIIRETEVLLLSLLKENRIQPDMIISVLFSATSDLDAAYPAIAARNIGIIDSALLCFNEMNVPGSLPKCIRILMHIETQKLKSEVRHIYLKGAKVLRPDLLAD